MRPTQGASKFAVLEPVGFDESCRTHRENSSPEKAPIAVNAEVRTLAELLCTANIRTAEDQFEDPSYLLDEHSTLTDSGFFGIQYLGDI